MVSVAKCIGSTLAAIGESAESTDNVADPGGMETVLDRGFSVCVFSDRGGVALEAAGGPPSGKVWAGLAPVRTAIAVPAVGVIGLLVEIMDG